MATVSEIADLVGASPAPVSRVLSGDPTFKISSELRCAIVEAAEKLGYISPRMRASAKKPSSKLDNRIATARRSLDGSVSNDDHMAMIHLGIERRSTELGFSIADVSIEDLNRGMLSPSHILGGVIFGGLANDEAIEWLG